MIKAILSVFFLIFTLSEFSYASIHQVMDPNLYLMGGLLGGKHYSFQLGVACVSGVDESHSDLSDCKQVSFVAFTKKRKAFFIGEPYPMASEADVKALLKKLVQLTPEEKTLKVGRGLLLFTGLFTGCSLIPGGDGRTAFYAVGGLMATLFIHAIIKLVITKKSETEISNDFFSGLDSAMTDPSQIFAKPPEKKLLKVTLNAEGWSEVQHPVRLKKDYFKRLINHIDPEALPSFQLNRY